MKKIISMILIMSLVMSIVVSNVIAESNLMDISEADWFYENVKVLDSKGILCGYSDGTFKPNDAITVDQFIKAMVVALGYNPELGKSYWAQPYIDKAIELGIVKKGEFNTYTYPITRAEMSLICIRVVEKLESEKTYQYDMFINNDLLNSIKDQSQIKEAFKKSVSNVYELGIIAGYNDGTFKPLNSLKRCEASTVIRRVIDPTQRIEVKIYADINIGAIVPKTGQVGIYGIFVENGFNLAVQEINEKGGIDGRKVKLITYDNRADATQTIQAFNDLTTKDQIVALLGPIISSTSLAVGELAEESRIPMITPSATNINVTLDLDYVYRTCYIDTYQGSCLAKFASDYLGAKNAAIIYNLSDDYSTTLAESFKDYFTALGGTISCYEGYSYDEEDFSLYLERIKKAKPEVLFIPNYYNSAGLIAKQVKEMGINAVMLGGDGWDDVHIEFADAMEGAYYADHFAFDNSDYLTQAFIKNYKAKYDEEPNNLSALGYDTANIMFTAIDQANSTDPVQIRNVLNNQSFKGVTGDLSFDKNGDPIKDIFIIKIEGGELKLETNVKVPQFVQD